MFSALIAKQVPVFWNWWVAYNKITIRKIFLIHIVEIEQVIMLIDCDRYNIALLLID